MFIADCCAKDRPTLKGQIPNPQGTAVRRWRSSAGFADRSLISAPVHEFDARTITVALESG